MTTAADWDQCLAMDEATCVGNCVFDLGIDLVPTDAEYCSPLFLTKNASNIMACVDA
jgi:hypothetical protein